MRYSGKTSLRRIHILYAFGIFVAWTVVTYLLEGRILTLLRPEAVLARLIYAVVANVLVGVVAAGLLLRHLIRTSWLPPDHYGLRPAGRTLLGIVLGAMLGSVVFVLQRPPALNQVVLVNGFARVWVVSVAEVFVCWVVLAKTVEASGSVGGSRWTGMAKAWIVAAVAFGMYHFAHSPPFNTPQMVGLLTVVGLVTGAFFFAVGELYGTIIFHNVLALKGVTQALADAGKLSQFEVLQIPLIVVALIATAALVGVDVFILRRER